MKLERFTDAQTFFERTRAFLLEHEVVNNLLFGIIDTLVNDPGRYESRPYLALARSAKEVAAVALRTPPQALVLSRASDLRAVEPFGQDLSLESLPGVSGPAREAKAFAKTWHVSTGQTYTLNMPQRIYKLERVVPVENVAGRLRPATPEDRLQLVKWTDAFNREALSSGPSRDPEAIVVPTPSSKIACKIYRPGARQP